MKKFLITIIIFIVLVGLGYVGYFLYQKDFFGFSKFNFINVNYDENCITAKEENIVRGDSLTDIINNGEIIEILAGYYECNEIKIDDIIAYNFSGNPDPIIKIIKALPSDTFSLKLGEKGNYNILVNNQILTTSTGQPYKLTEAKSKMLALYVNDYKGVIPKDSYLILGNKPTGTLDSTRFGLINKEGIIGKVMYK